MVKQKLLIFYMVAIFIFVLSPVSKVMAQSDCSNPPDTCYAGNCLVTVVDAGVLDTLPGPDGQLGTNDDITAYRWTYDFSGCDTSKFSDVLFSLPYQCNDPIDIVYGPANMKYYDPCVGDTNTNFGQYMCNARTLSVPYQQVIGGVTRYVFWTAENVTGLIGGPYIKAGKQVYACNNGILGPGYGIPDTVIDSSTVIDTPAGPITVVKNRKTGCIDHIITKYWVTGNPPFIKEGEHIADVGNLDDLNCRYTFVNAPGHSYYIWNGSKYICIYGCN